MKCYGNYEVNDATPQMEKKSKKWFPPSSNCNWWYLRDSRNLSGCAGILFFIIIMIIFFCNVETRENPRDENQQENEPLLLRQNTQSVLQSYCSSSGAKISCSNASKDSMVKVQEEINYLSEKNADNNISLIFTELQDAVSIMKPNWLQNVTKRIQSLTIRKSFLPNINAESFSGDKFNEMEELSLELIGDLTLNSSSFSGLNGLLTLNVRGMKIVLAEEETLRTVSSTLSTLQLQSCISNPQVIRNLTGGNKMFAFNKLKIIDVRQNQYKTLLAKTFTKSPNIISLYLDYSNFVDSLDAETFVGTIPVQVSMTFTKLTTLPQGIFEPFQNRTKLFITDNEWNCVCSFQWFQDFYENSNMFQDRTLKCYMSGQSYDLDTFPFCGSSTTSTSTSSNNISSAASPTGKEYTTVSSDIKTTQRNTKFSTEKPSTKITASPVTREYTTASTNSWTNRTTGVSTDTTSTTDRSKIKSTSKTSTDSSTTNTTPDPLEYDEVSCSPAKRIILGSGSFENSPSRTIYLESRNIRVEFHQMANEAKYAVTIEQSLGDDMVLILLNSDGWALCLSDIQNNFVLESLQYGETYIVCILEAQQHTVSPKNCQSLNVPNEWANQSWIENGYKLPIIIGMVLGILTTILLSSVGMYIYVKRNPDFVYGKENVILIERENSTNKKSGKVLNYPEQRYTPSLMSMSDGYVTPKVYESVEECHVPIPSLDRYDSQQTIKIYPTLRRKEVHRDADTSKLSKGDVIESVNVWLSPISAPNPDLDSLQNIYNSL